MWLLFNSNLNRLRHENILFLFLAISMKPYAQENDSLEPFKNKEVSFVIVKNPPIYKGCSEKYDSEQLRICMSSKLNGLVRKNFNTSIANNTDLERLVKIQVLFKVETDGSITFLEAKAPHPLLKKESKRIAELIPRMTKPGSMVKGKPVIVPYTLPIAFHINKTN